jgi:hypothetical protein
MANSAFTPLVLQDFREASVSQPGLMGTGAQSFAGDKTFTGNLNVVGNGRGIVPLGAIIAMTTSITGAMAVPASGAASNGWQRADGAAIAGGSTLTGNTPNLSTSVFLRGATTYGGTGGGTVSLARSNIPDLTSTGTSGAGSAHSHGAGTYTSNSSLTGTTTFATSGHKHGIAHVHQWGVVQGAANNFKFFNNAAIANNSDPSDSYGNSSTPGIGVSLGGGATLLDIFANRSPQYTSNPALCNDGSSGVASKSDGADASSSVGISNGTITGTSGSESAHTHSLSVASTGTSGSATGNAFNVVPNYIDVIYLIRVA